MAFEDALKQQGWPRGHGLAARWLSRLGRRLRRRDVGPAAEVARSAETRPGAPARLGPKRRALLERTALESCKRALGYLLGMLVLGFSLFRAARLFAEQGSVNGMVDVLIGVFTGIIILFLVSHDGAVARKQGTD